MRREAQFTWCRIRLYDDEEQYGFLVPLTPKYMDWLEAQELKERVPAAPFPIVAGGVLLGSLFAWRNRGTTNKGAH